MPRFSQATLNHSTLHGLPSQWEAHLDGIADAGYTAIAPDIFWLRALEAEGFSPDRLANELDRRGLACMEIAGIAIGEEAETRADLDVHLRFAEALGAEFINTRFTRPIGPDVVARARACAEAFHERSASGSGPRLALEFSRGGALNDLAATRDLVRAIDVAGVGVTLDAWHFFLHPDGPDWESLDALTEAEIANVQLSDGVSYSLPASPSETTGEAEAAEMDRFRKATMDGRRLPGEGDFELVEFFRRLRRQGFDGAIVMEVLNADERARSVGDFADRSFRAAESIWSASDVAG